MRYQIIRSPAVIHIPQEVVDLRPGAPPSVGEGQIGKIGLTRVAIDLVLSPAVEKRGDAAFGIAKDAAQSFGIASFGAQALLDDL